MSYTEEHIIQLSSKNADLKNNGSYLSDVVFSFQGLLKRNERIKSKSISVLHAQFPLTTYAVNYSNNVIKYSVGGGSVYTSVITRGNYNAQTLLSALSTAFSANGVSITMAFSQITGLVTFSHLSQDFTFYEVDNSILPVIGLDNTTITSIANTLVCPYPLNTLGALNFQIQSHQLITKNYNSRAGGQSTLLSTIPITCVTWGLVAYDNTTGVRNILYNDVINSIDIQIYDNTGYLVNFNNADWEITLVLEIEYLEKDPIVKIADTLNQVATTLENTVESILPQPDTSNTDQTANTDTTDTTDETPADTTDMELWLLTH